MKTAIVFIVLLQLADGMSVKNDQSIAQQAASGEEKDPTVATSTINSQDKDMKRLMEMMELACQFQFR